MEMFRQIKILKDNDGDTYYVSRSGSCYGIAGDNTSRVSNKVDGIVSVPKGIDVYVRETHDVYLDNEWLGKIVQLTNGMYKWNDGDAYCAVYNNVENAREDMLIYFTGGEENV